VARSVLVELLRFIAANEDLPRTLQRYPGHDRDAIGKLVAAAADRLEAAEAGASAEAPSGAKGLKVRKASTSPPTPPLHGVERGRSEFERAAQRSAQELDESMDLSKVDQERRRRERSAAADREREEAKAVQAAPPTRTRLFTDGAARGNPGPAGAGAVIVNPNGHIVAKVGKFLGESTNNVAEYMGLILGLKRAKAMGIRELEVLADSELLVRQLHGDYAVKAEHLKPLHAEASELLKAFPGAIIRHIPREENSAADAMSNRAIDERL
jgi:ribonuclease HI